MQYSFTKTINRNHILTKTVALAVLLLVLLGAQSAVYASGKPVGKKRLFLIPAAAYFFNSTYWDANGVSRTYDNNRHFGSVILSLNSEYGFSRRVSLVGSIPYVINHISQTGGPNSSISGLGDAELGVRYYFANINYNVYFSVQGNAVIPLYSNAGDKSLGYQALGGDVKFIAAGDFNIGSKKFYFEANTGVRQFFTNSGPFQLKNSLSLSYSLNKKNQVSLAGTSLYSYSSTKTSIDVNNPLNVANVKQFSFNQLTGSYSYSIQRNKSVFVSFSKFITGTNTGQGTTLSLGYVYKY